MLGGKVKKPRPLAEQGAQLIVFGSHRPHPLTHALEAPVPLALPLPGKQVVGIVWVASPHRGHGRTHCCVVHVHHGPAPRHEQAHRSLD